MTGRSAYDAARIRRIAALAATAALVAALAAPAAQAQDLNPRDVTPMIFVHGGSGSAGQFQAQQLRLTSNGFPQSRIFVYEYDTATALTDNLGEVIEGLNAAIARVKARTGAAKVDVLGHSRGTSVMHFFLAEPARAANVRRYVNIDGRTADSPPGGVRTLAVWAGRGEPGRSIGGARNVTIPNQTHVQSATSAESFAEIFRFLVGRRSRTTRIVPGRRTVSVAGRALVFLENTGMKSTRLQVWRVAQASGRRLGGAPVARPALSATGAWGPIRLRRGQRYEFALVRSGGATHHIYPEPFRRDDHLVRLLSSPPGGGIEALLGERSARASGLVITRYKELWGDQGAQSDVLEVNGVNVINAATSPIDNRTNAVFVLDAGADGVSNPGMPVSPFFGLSFLTGADLFLPASSPPTGRVTVALRSRGSGPIRRLNVPNFPSTQHLVSVVFDDV